MWPHGFEVFRVVAKGEECSVNFGMQSLDAAVHHFGEAGHVRNVGDVYAGFAKRAGCSAG